MNKNILSRIVQGVLSIGLGTVLQIMLGLAGFMIAVRVLPKEELGVFVLIETIYTLYGLLSSIALENYTVTKFIASDEAADRQNVVNTAVTFKIVITVVLSAIILACGPLLGLVFNKAGLSKYMIYVLLFFVFSSLYEMFLRILQGFHLYRRMAISQILNGAATLAFIILFMLLLKNGLLGFIYANLFAFMASIFYQYWAIPIKKRLVLDRGLLRRMVRFGFPLGLNNILYYCYSRIDRLMLFGMVSPVGLAAYDVAGRVPNRIHRLYGSFVDVLFPNISECLASQRIREAERILNNSIRLFSFATLGAALIINVYQKEIVRLLFSDRYLESAPALAMIMVTMCVATIGSILGTSLVALGQSDKPVKVNLVNAATNIACNIALIPVLGIMGAAYAAFISHSATIPLYVWYLKKGGIRVEISQYLKPLSAYAAIAVLLYYIQSASMILRSSMIIVFLLACFFLSIFKTADIKKLFEGLKPVTPS